VSDVIALKMSAKTALQTCWCWLKVLCNHTLGIFLFSIYMLESADEFKTKMKTELQYKNYNNNKAKDPILVEHHHLFI
jgi:hypothetical protein